MDFSLTAEQRMLQESVAGVLARVSSLDRVRAFAAGDGSVARDAWSALTELGVAGLMIGETHGGLGLTLLDAALVGEAAGAWVAPAPLLGAVLAPLALQGGGSPAQQDEWLPRLATGRATAAVVMAEAVSGSRDGAGVRCENGRLTGTALFVVGGMTADLLIVADTQGSVHLATRDGVTANPLTTIDRTRQLAELRFDNAPAEPLAGSVEPLRNAAWVMLAADMLGASQAMLQKAVAYTQERRQFGRVIGSFQAVKHMCAEMAAELEPCRALVWYAAYAAEAAPAEAPLMAAHAKAVLSEVSRFVARTATEVHGGMGFTDLVGLHYWFKRVGLDRQLFGGPERVRVEAARMQGLAA